MTDIRQAAEMQQNTDRFYIEFGTALKKRRLESNLTQDELASRVGLGRTSITNIEKGRQQVSLHLFCQLAAAMGADAKSLLPDRSSPLDDAAIPPALATSIASLDDVQRQWVRDFFASAEARAALASPPHPT